MKAEMTLLPGDPGYDDALNALKCRARDVQCKEYKAALFLRIADAKRYSGLKDQLDDLNLLDKDSYPKTMESALQFLQNYKGVGGKSHENSVNYSRQDHDGVAFPQVGNQAGGRGSKDISNHTCYNCGEKGHHAKTCPKISGEEHSQLAMNHANISKNVDVQECVEGVTNINLCNESYEDTSDGSTGTVDSCIC